MQTTVPTVLTWSEQGCRTEELQDLVFLNPTEVPRNSNIRQSIQMKTGITHSRYFSQFIYFQESR